MTADDDTARPQLRLVATGDDPRRAPPGRSTMDTFTRPRLQHGHRPGPRHTGPCRTDNDCDDDEICFGGNCT